MSLDLSRNRMEGISGLAMISPQQRNLFNKFMKPPTEPALASFTSGLGLHNFMQANIGLGSVGGVTAFNPSFSHTVRPGSNRLPSPKSPSSRESSGEHDMRGKAICSVYALSQVLFVCLLKHCAKSAVLPGSESWAGSGFHLVRSWQN